VVADATHAVRDLAEAYWDRYLELDPLLATTIGDERFDDRLPDPSENGLARRKELNDWALAEAGRIDRTNLDLEPRATLDILEAAAQRILGDLEQRIDRLQAVTHLFGPGSLLADLAATQRADTPDRLDRYLSRLSAMPVYLDAVGRVAEGAAVEGQTAPTLVADRTIAQVERLLAIEPEHSPAMEPVAGASDEDRDRVASVVRRDVWPAYQRYLDALRRYRPLARETIGLRDLPGGDAMYASQIKAFTTLPLEATTVHEIGVETLAGIQEERRTIARRLGHADVETAVGHRAENGGNLARSREDLLELVRQQVQRSWDAAPRFFGRLPKANCQVRPVEEFREDDMPGAYYQAPSMDGSRLGVYYVNTGGLDGRPLHQVATTSYHEANPGHHFQLSIEAEFSDRLLLRRYGGWLLGDAFIEGWGLYSERLADEMGLFVDDYERLGMLEAQGLRAGRLIVDTGIHALGWSREQAVQQMMETGATRLDSEIEVDRYIAWPGQALAYMVGCKEIQRWRAEASQREGRSFSLTSFHDRLLSLGSLPLAALERELSTPPAA
jgi:uncharacterized protein (DUF885 family)